MVMGMTPPAIEECLGKEDGSAEKCRGIFLIVTHQNCHLLDMIQKTSTIHRMMIWKDSKNLKRFRMRNKKIILEMDYSH